jgi:hypothetical protein
MACLGLLEDLGQISRSLSACGVWETGNEAEVWRVAGRPRLFADFPRAVVAPMGLPLL